jgi:diguanylate cyclase (GGDEF)-like protein/PAS domain S-box-containing protein
MNLARFVPGPTLRIAAGLASLVLLLMMVANLAFDLVPDREGQARRLRSVVAEATTTQVTDYLRGGHADRIVPLLDSLRARTPDLNSVALRQADGHVLGSSGAHHPAWATLDTPKSTLTQVLVPIHSAQGQWGRMEFDFAPIGPQGWAAWLRDRSTWLWALLPLAGLLLMYLYLRRALLHLNPMSVVPERLRDAFDALTEGVALMDGNGRIVLANEALRRMAGVDQASIHGRRFAEGARVQLADTPGATAPWELVLREGRVVRGTRVLLGDATRSAGMPARVGMLNCSPVSDANGRTRGCLATIADVTDIEQHNEELRRALAELERSREQIEAQNQELVRLATRDALTGLLNRRAFFDTASRALERAADEGRAVAILMMDVDHFKSFNDKHGHAVGDMVLQGVAKAMLGALRQQDVVARYGGEEFCALMEVNDAAQALELAERVRRQVQAHAGQGLRDGRDLMVTASVGLITRRGPGAGLSDLLNLADGALYEAKRAGRNRVRVASVAAAGVEVAAP